MKRNVCPPTVDKRFKEMNGMQRATESFRYNILVFERFISPQGHISEWLRRNALLGTFLFIPAVLVMPAIGLMLWQVDKWLSLLVSMVSTLLTHPLQIFFLLIVLKICMASTRRSFLHRGCGHNSDAKRQFRVGLM